MTQQKTTVLWRKSGDENLKLVDEMIEHDHRDWALFFGQLALEKYLKGIIVKTTDSAPPFIHDLVKLAEIAHLSLTPEQKEELAEISKYHIKARYDDIKKELYTKATPEYTKTFVTKIKKYALWLTKHY